MSSYIWEIFAKAWHFSFPAFGLDRVLPTARSYRVSFGFWLRIGSEGSNNQITSTAMREAPVHYSPLKKNSDIRLFVLNPGSDGDTITGHMEHIEVKYPYPPFEALSYVWGETDNCATILVDDACVSVTKSLDTALRRLRFPDRPRTLWVDYICINQYDVEERNRQVARMGYIYYIAETVLVWLGEANPDTAVGIKVLDYFVSEQRPHPQPVWQDHPSSVVRDGLLDILNRPWFQRMWVVQEIGMSQNVVLICGRHEVKWRSSDSMAVRRFMRMIKFAELSPQWEQMGLGIVDMQPFINMLDIQIGNQLDKSSGGTLRRAPDLLDVAHSMRHKACADPHDKLFGIYGLLEGTWALEDFKPDYNMTVAQMYEALAELSFL